MKVKPAVEKERVVNGRYASVRFPRSATNAEELAEMRRRAWVHQGVLTLRPAELADDWLQAALESWAVRQYGPRQPPPAMRQPHNSP